MPPMATPSPCFPNGILTHRHRPHRRHPPQGDILTFPIGIPAKQHATVTAVTATIPAATATAGRHPAPDSTLRPTPPQASPSGMAARAAGSSRCEAGAEGARAMARARTRPAGRPWAMRMAEAKPTEPRCTGARRLFSPWYSGRERSPICMGEGNGR